MLKWAALVLISLAVVFVLVMAGAITWVIYYLFLVPFDLVYLRTIAFILVIASLVQFVELFLKKSIPALYAGLGIFLPLIAVNCAILGSSLFLVEREYNLLESTVFGFSAGFGFFLAITAMAAIRTKLRYSNVPDGLRGLGLTMLITGLMAMAFMSFSGISL